MRAEGGKVFDREGAAARLHVGRDAPRQIALVEIARARVRQMGKRRLQPVLRQAHAGLDTPLRIRRQAVVEIGGGAGRIAPQVGCRAGNHQGGPPIHQQPFAGEIDARAQQFLPGQSGVAAMRLFHARHHAGHGDRTGAVKVAVVLDPRPGEDVGGGGFACQRIVLGADAAGARMP